MPGEIIKAKQYRKEYLEEQEKDKEKEKKKMSSFDTYLNEQLKKPEFKAKYDALEPEFAVIQTMIDARKSLYTATQPPYTAKAN